MPLCCKPPGTLFYFCLPKAVSFHSMPSEPTTTEQQQGGFLATSEKKKKIPRKENKTKNHPGIIFLLTSKTQQSTKKKNSLKNSNLYHSHSSKNQSSQVRPWQSWSNSAQCWEELWSRMTLYQTHIKSVLASIICKRRGLTLSAIPNQHNPAGFGCNNSHIWI